MAKSKLKGIEDAEKTSSRLIDQPDVIERLPSDPPAEEGRIYYNTVEKRLKIYVPP